MKKNNQINKIALGTVQFGLDYGISNKNGKVKYNDVEKIINFALQKGINTLDTANGYGLSEKVLGEIGVRKFNVITKFTAQTKDQLIDQLDSSISNLKLENIYGYLSHKPNQIFNNLDLWDLLLKFKKTGKIKKIGFSLNNIDDFNNLNKFNIKPDIVQIPYNIFDHRFIGDAIKLKKKGTEIHSRSTFLQGLFFMDPKNITPNLIDLKSNLIKLHLMSKFYNISISEIALNYVCNNRYVDKVLFGVQSIENIKENIKSISKILPLELYKEISKIKIKNKTLLNPSNWI